MPGLIALVGGNEFRPECEAMDRSLLARIGTNPRVIILPTAAARENPGLAAGNGIRHFKRLGARAAAAMVVDSATAQDGKWLALIQNADLVYLPGGDPVYLLETLRNSAAWEAVRGVWESGRSLAGSSAGAMILGGRMWAPGQGWREGLGLLPQFAVIPHHSRLAEAWKAKDMLASLPEKVTLVGIDEATALAGPPWEVVGMGKVVIYGADKATVFTPGQPVKLALGIKSSL
jgi:cyanophycinase